MAVVNAMAHVVVTEGLIDQSFMADRCEGFEEWAQFISGAEHSPEAVEPITGVPAEELRAAARLYAQAPNGAIYYGLGVTEHSQGSTMVMGMANLAMACGNIGRDGVGVNPLRGQNNVQGSCDMGSFPHELQRLPARVGRRSAKGVRKPLGNNAFVRAGVADPEHVRRRDRGHLPGSVRPR